MIQEKCGYQLVDGPCNAPIYFDRTSYTTYSHEGPLTTYWLHWASPEPYGQGLEETQKLFRKCTVCGKLPDDNEEHFLYSGHRFITS